MIWSFRHLVIWSLFSISSLVFRVSGANAIYAPASVPNNKYGIHILDPQEVDQAAKLVNSTGGDWGYVTIPIRTNDLSRPKWQTFFQACRRLHLIPIVRLATYPEGSHWVKPDAYDLVDFANFLSDMPWPTANRYLVVFNEPNHHSEWGGEVNPLEYATLLLQSRAIFKSRSSNFFIISAGLDISAPNSLTSADAFRYYRQMTSYQPNWYQAIDGLGVHVYSPSRYGLTSYSFETRFLAKLGFTPKPIFVTETGSTQPDTIYPGGLTNVLHPDPQVVAITPFLLFAGSPDFSAFSLLDLNHSPKNSYYQLLHIPKAAGSPLLSEVVLSPQLPTVDSTSPPPTSPLNFFYNLIFHRQPGPTLTIGNTQISIEIAATPASRARGLSSRASLGQDWGMLFIFPDAGVYSFWMKDMRFPLDFIWIADQKVVQITTNVPATQPPQTLMPTQPVSWVVEVNSGFAARHHIQVGDPVVLNSVE